jgi:hypothetical protein
MAQRIQNLAVSAPAFFGLNTEGSPIGMSPNFADVADNCVIDKQGRIGARQGYTAVSTNGATVLGSSRGLEAVFEYTSFAGVKVVFSAGNNKIFTGTTTLTEVTLPVGYTISANNWKIVSFNNDVYFYQSGHEPLRSVAGSTTLINVTNGGHSSPAANEVLAAFGRLWIADVVGNNYTVYWSDLLNGNHWQGGSSGSLDLTLVWPTGYDEIVALTEHNGFLLIFGRHSVIIYTGADIVSTTGAFKLHDTIEGVGCIERDSVQATGNDILFLSDRGVMSLGRLVQEKSLPLRDVSGNVRTDLINLTKAETLPIHSFYSAFDAFYLLTFPTSGTTYCFDVRAPLEDGAFRATTWSSMNPVSFGNIAADGFYIGVESGLVSYGGYLDGAATYKMSYFSNPLDWGNTTNLKFLKKFNVTVIGGSGASFDLNWGYDYSGTYNKQPITFGAANTAQFNVSEYNTLAEYSGGVSVNKATTNTSGSGVSVSVGIETTINTQPFSIQTIDIHALLGRII